MQLREWTATERAVGQIWSDILKIDEIGLDDDFFDLGGTSLALISVVMRMGERFGLPLETAIVTEGATIAALANGVDAKLRAKAKLEVV
jgi:acyl carrier protein